MCTRIKDLINLFTLDFLADTMTSLGDVEHGLCSQVQDSRLQWGREGSNEQSELSTHPAVH